MGGDRRAPPRARSRGSARRSIDRAPPDSVWRDAGPRSFADLRLSVLDAAAWNRAAGRNADLRRSGLRRALLFEHDRRAQQRTCASASRTCNGKRFAYNAADSLSGYLVLRAAMKDAHVDPDAATGSRPAPPRVGPGRGGGFCRRRGDRRRLLGARASLRAGGGVAPQGHRQDAAPPRPAVHHRGRAERLRSADDSAWRIKEAIADPATKAARQALRIAGLGTFNEFDYGPIAALGRRG